MAEKDVTVRLRRAVKENSLFLVKRLIKKTDIRNLDYAPRRFTSLAWAAVLGHDEIFEFLLAAGHDGEDDPCRDSENNTILMLLAEAKPPLPNPYAPHTMQQHDLNGAILRMARIYIDRYPKILDWSNIQGRTALHIAALNGNEDLATLLCDLGADVNLADNCGNTALHYASSWGHIAIVQLLIERGCQHSVKNNCGFTASDYAYSHSMQDTLLTTAKMQYELQRKQRRNQVNRGTDWNGSSISLSPPVLSKTIDDPSRTRSGSGTSRTTTTSDSGDQESNTITPSSQLPLPGSATLQTTSGSSLYQPILSANSTGGLPSSTKPVTLSPPSNHISALSPIANRVREMDADAMEKYMRRTRSGSQGTTQPGGSTIKDDMMAPSRQAVVISPKRLRPSASAAQLRTPTDAPLSSSGVLPTHIESRNRAGTNPSAARTPGPVHSNYMSESVRSIHSPEQGEREGGTYTGPPSQYAQFPDPPAAEESTPIAGRRKGLNLLSKVSSGDGVNHRRGMSAASVRGS
ncbi:hypothetical protein AMATHDRAFT_172880 [Amanita thiersii Skay4041]|uniref:Uncharacterized protein n=1 Tax=Amanita thiersii Skay4041 TaxID=703135 RepID=A0A2A9NY89_9AGAR|nr:hypothetical protein AMATHDRAFT_172880 [Amanita thiersii Skay4041]